MGSADAAVKSSKSEYPESIRKQDSKMPHTLDRTTTEYIDTEDRLRLSGQYADVPAVVIWLIQRLIYR